MSLLNQQVEHLNLPGSDYALLLSALPYQFYAWLTLAAIPMTALIGYDFQLMREADTYAGLRSTGAKRLTPSSERSAVCAASFGYHFSFWAQHFCGPSPLGFPFERVSGSQFRAGLSAAYLITLSW